MKRIAGTFVLLAGLSGCVTFTSPTAQGDKKLPGAGAVAGATTLPPLPGETPPAPGYNTWEPGAGHLVARNTLPPGAPTPPAPIMPPPAPPAALPATAVAKATELPGLPPGMPMVKTPPKEKDATADAGTRPVAFTGSDKMPEIITPGAKAVAMPPAPSMKEPPAPASVEAPAPAGTTARTAPGGPLFRLVNTKRITLNFEVKDVGSSGLAAVDLWYTPDGKDWKKHEAPTNAQAYVVEVDEEGMYGFTLVARSGIGLGKEPPAAGDQPQVWVIVDLSAPEVVLSEVVPVFSGKSQHVTIKWQASDKNLGRQPVTLSYAEKAEGPWKVIAANLDAMGSYKWQVPDGMPPRVLLRVEAADMAGNVGQVQSSKAIVLDSARPVVKIVNVEPNAGR